MDLTEDWQEYMLQIVGKMFAQTVYEFDTVVTLLSEENIGNQLENEMLNRKWAGMMKPIPASFFILCSLNKTEQPKKALLFDYIEKGIQIQYGL